MNKKKIVSLLLALTISIFTLASCGKNTGTTSSSTGTLTALTGSADTSAISIASTVTYDSDDYYFDWQSKSYQTINLNQDFAAISKSGIYEITGTLKDGSLVVDVDKTTDSGTVYLVLNNATVSSTTSAPIYVKNAEKVVLMLENGTTNSIYQGSGCKVDADDEPSAAIFSKADLTITGSGTLKVTSDYNDGISGKDTLKIIDGTLNVTAKGDGIVGKDVLAVKQGTITVTAVKNGIRSTNDTDTSLGNILIAGGTLSITSGSDAAKAKGTLEIDGGTLNVTTGGGYAQNTTVQTDNNFGKMNSDSAQTTETSTDTESINGLSACRNIIVTQGNVTVSAYDDALNAGTNLLIQDGILNLQAGDDGIHSDTNVTIDNGTITIKHSNEGIEGSNITINNGKITLTTSDDGFNVNDNSGLETINGGVIVINAQGDGLDSNGSAKMTGGTVHISGPTANGDGALDYNGTFTISGGTLIAAGSSGMAESGSTDSTQPSILMYYSTTQAAGTTITLKDSSANTVATYTPEKQYTSAVISSPNMKTGQSYTLYSGSTKVVTFTLADTVTYLNESGITENQGMNAGGGGPGSHGPRN
ncbi:carbohydrate-binding domain-containing protein [Dehalobacter sp. DCM]|uniref:carbohydrate-binding domain-containing protein n=1 Tax=Dehalobacter sp. DCM TaxID=2907827 RepID=UPI0030819A5F|nr:carbohydrate-binding domain-containing protein [Dehalobacter sp. DCM]